MANGRKLLLGVLAAVLAACSASATPAPTAGPTAAPSVGPTKTTDGTLPKPELAAIKIGITLGEISQFAPKLAEYAGIYEKYGLKAEVIVFSSEANVQTAVVSGQVEMGSLGPTVLNSALTENPLNLIGSLKTKVFDGLFCNKDIKTAADLKGKQVAISSLGGVPHASLLLALESLKLQPNDVVPTQVGSQAPRIAALKAGSVACAPIGIEFTKELSDLGFNLLVDIAKSGVEYPSAGPIALKAWLAKNSNTALVATAAMLEAQDMLIRRPLEAAPYWAKHAQIDGPKAEELAKILKDVINPTLRWRDASVVFAQSILAIVTPGIMMVDPKTVYDRSYLQKLEDIGFYKKLGITP